VTRATRRRRSRRTRRPARSDLGPTDVAEQRKIEPPLHLPGLDEASAEEIEESRRENRREHAEADAGSDEERAQREPRMRGNLRWPVDSVPILKGVSREIELEFGRADLVHELFVLVNPILQSRERDGARRIRDLEILPRRGWEHRPT